MRRFIYFFQEREKKGDKVNLIHLLVHFSLQLSERRCPVVVMIVEYDAVYPDFILRLLIVIERESLHPVGWFSFVQSTSQSLVLRSVYSLTAARSREEEWTSYFNSLCQSFS